MTPCVQHLGWRRDVSSFFLGSSNLTLMIKTYKSFVRNTLSEKILLQTVVLVDFLSHCPRMFSLFFPSKITSLLFFLLLCNFRDLLCLIRLHFDRFLWSTNSHHTFSQKKNNASCKKPSAFRARRRKQNADAEATQCTKKRHFTFLSKEAYELGLKGRLDKEDPTSLQQTGESRGGHSHVFTSLRTERRHTA
jgi:hypothetical protein